MLFADWFLRFDVQYIGCSSLSWWQVVLLKALTGSRVEKLKKNKLKWLIGAKVTRRAVFFVLGEYDVNLLRRCIRIPPRSIEKGF